MQTPLRIVFKDTPNSPILEALVRSHVARIEKRHRNILSCRVVLEAPHKSAEGQKLPLGISVELTIPKHTLVAHEQQEHREVKNDHVAVVARAFDAIERQLEDETRIMRGDVKRHDRARDASTPNEA
jgi:hypothetical protein